MSSKTKTKTHATKHNATHTDTNMTAIFQEQSCTYLVENLFLKPTAKLCASLADNSSTFGIVGLWALHGSPNIFHRRLVRSRPFAGIGRFLAGLVTFLSRRPVAKQLGANGRNWLRTIITITKKIESKFSALSFATLCGAAKCGLARMQMNGGKQLERQRLRKRMTAKSHSVTQI